MPCVAACRAGRSGGIDGRPRAGRARRQLEQRRAPGAARARGSRATASPSRAPPAPTAAARAPAPGRAPSSGSRPAACRTASCSSSTTISPGRASGAKTAERVPITTGASPLRARAPGAQPLRSVQPGVQHRERRAEALGEARHQLRRERDLRHQHQRLLAARARRAAIARRYTSVLPLPVTPCSRNGAKRPAAAAIASMARPCSGVGSGPAPRATWSARCAGPAATCERAVTQPRCSSSRRCSRQRGDSAASAAASAAASRRSSASTISRRRAARAGSGGSSPARAAALSVQRSSVAERVGAGAQRGRQRRGDHLAGRMVVVVGGPAQQLEQRRDRCTGASSMSAIAARSLAAGQRRTLVATLDQHADDPPTPERHPDSHARTAGGRRRRRAAPGSRTGAAAGRRRRAEDRRSSVGPLM